MAQALPIRIRGEAISAWNTQSMLIALEMHSLMAELNAATRAQFLQGFSDGSALVEHHLQQIGFQCNGSGIWSAPSEETWFNLLGR